MLIRKITAWENYTEPSCQQKEMKLPKIINILSQAMIKGEGIFIWQGPNNPTNSTIMNFEVYVHGSNDKDYAFMFDISPVLHIPETAHRLLDELLKINNKNISLRRHSSPPPRREAKSAHYQLLIKGTRR